MYGQDVCMYVYVFMSWSFCLAMAMSLAKTKKVNQPRATVDSISGIKHGHLMNASKGVNKSF